MGDLTALNVLLVLLAVYLSKRVLEGALGRRRGGGGGNMVAPAPPGPPGYPVIGNLFDMPNEKEWLAYIDLGRKWGADAGGLLSLTVLGRRLLIVNSLEDASGLFEKQLAPLISDRPSLPMVELVGWGRFLGGAMVFGERNRMMRRLFHQTIGTPALVARFEWIEEEETGRLLRRLLKTPEEFSTHIRMLAGTIILRISHGYRTKESNDYFVDLADQVMVQFSHGMRPNAFLVNFIPILKHIPGWIPGMQFKRLAKQWHDTLMQMVLLPHQFAKEEMAEKRAEASVTSRLLEQFPNPDAEIEDTIKWVTASMYAGGSDTTVASINAFIKAMVLYPDVQHEAQKELDALLGQARLPTTADRAQLPYVNALVLEALRWHAVSPLSAPRIVHEDCVYKGYMIKKGTIVQANIWYMSHNPENYKDPMTFNPKRFLPENGEPEQDPRGIIFGFGRRVCPGRILADSSVFLACASILSVFDISPAVEDGKPLLPDTDQSTGIVSHPSPFKCNITPRPTTALELITSGGM